MLFFAGFNRRVKKNVKTIMSGYDLSNKLKLLVILFCRLVSKVSSFTFVKDKVKHVENLLWSKTVVKAFSNYKFALVDRESFIIVSPEFEHFMLTWFAPKRSEVFIDIGAHVGKYTVMGAKMVGEEGHVIAIEPHPLNYEKLLQNIKLNELRNVTALNIAAWNSNAKVKLFTHEVGGHHSVKSNVGLGFIEVNAARVDDVLDEMGSRRVDWIKIDVEGAEYQVLQGLEKTICLYKPKILMEVFHENIHYIKNFLKNYDYHIIKISPAFKENVYFLCLHV